MAETAAIAVFFKVPYHPHQQKIRMTQLNSLSLSLKWKNAVRFCDLLEIESWKFLLKTNLKIKRLKK